jgi:hypothetical protein
VPMGWLILTLMGRTGLEVPRGKIRSLNPTSQFFSLICNIYIIPTTDYRYEFESKTVQGGTVQYFKWIEGFITWKNVLESTSNLLPLASKTNFAELYAKPSRAPTLIFLPCCAILACSKVGTWD